jgi:hypothetical protein
MRGDPFELSSDDPVAKPLPEPSFDWRDFRPEMLPDESRFVVELTTYRDHLDSLLAHAGKYVAIKGPTIIGIYDDFDAAVEAAFRFAPEVLVKRIVEKEPVHELGHIW